MTDPTNIIDTRERAAVLAHAMLRLAPNPAPQAWQSTGTVKLLVGLVIRVYRSRVVRRF